MFILDKLIKRNMKIKLKLEFEIYLKFYNTKI